VVFTVPIFSIIVTVIAVIFVGIPLLAIIAAIGIILLAIPLAIIALIALLFVRAKVTIEINEIFSLWISFL
jgi:hypothetical protein